MTVKIIYEKNELANDIRSLLNMGLEMDVAKEVAEFKRIADEAAHRMEIGVINEDDISEELSDALWEAHELLQQAFFLIRDAVNPAEV